MLRNLFEYDFSICLLMDPFLGLLLFSTDFFMILYTIILFFIINCFQQDMLLIFFKSVIQICSLLSKLFLTVLCTWHIHVNYKIYLPEVSNIWVRSYWILDEIMKKHHYYYYARYIRVPLLPFTFKPKDFLFT